MSRASTAFNNMNNNEETKIIIMQKDISQIKEKMDEFHRQTKDDMLELKCVMNNFINKSETLFASKWVEAAAKWTIALVIGAVILAVLSVVIKK